MADVTNLNKARAEKADDARLWTPVDALRDVLARIEAGKMKPDQVAIHCLTQDAGGGYTHDYFVAGMTVQEHIALLAVAQTRAIDGWIS